MVDTERLLKAIRNFEFKATPSSADDSKPCTVGDLNKVVSNLAKTLKIIVSELEKQ